LLFKSMKTKFPSPKTGYYWEEKRNMCKIITKWLHNRNLEKGEVNVHGLMTEGFTEKQHRLNPAE
jgi:hypothetical protein